MLNNEGACNIFKNVNMNEAKNDKINIMLSTTSCGIYILDKPGNNIDCIAIHCCKKFSLPTFLMDIISSEIIVSYILLIESIIKEYHW